MSKNIIASAAIGLSLFALGVVGSKAQGSNSTLTKELILKTGTYNSLLKTGAQSSNYTYTLPITTPTANQVLTATAVSGTDVTLGWSSAGGGGGVTYGPGSAQNSLTPVTTRLFDVGYASGSGNAAGALITSSTTSGTAVGLQVNASGTTSVTGANFSATGGTTNYALVVSGGNVALGPATTAPEIRFFEPSGGGSEYSSIKAGAQGSVVNYTLPTTQPAASGRALVVSNVSGAGPYDVSLDWSSAAPGTGNSTQTVIRITTPQTYTGTTFTDATGLSFSVDANTTYRFEMLLFMSGENNKFTRTRFVAPTGTTCTFAWMEVGPNSVGSRYAINEAQSTESPQVKMSDPGDRGYLVVGTITTAGTAGTWKMQIRNETSNTMTILAGTNLLYTK